MAAAIFSALPPAPGFYAPSEISICRTWRFISRRADFRAQMLHHQRLYNRFWIDRTDVGTGPFNLQDLGVQVQPSAPVIGKKLALKNLR